MPKRPQVFGALVLRARRQDWPRLAREYTCPLATSYHHFCWAAVWTHAAPQSTQVKGLST